MTALATWQSDNNEYLTAALEWLQLVLSRAAESESDDTDALHRLFHILKRHRCESDEQIDEARLRREAVAERMQTPPALLQLAGRFDLSDFEQNLLLLCAGVELHTAMAPLCAAAQGDPGRDYPTFALALALLENPAWDVLSPHAPLRYWRLLEINQPGSTPLTVSSLRIDERILSYLKGLNYLDDRLAPLVSRMDPLLDDTRLSDSQSTSVEAIRRQVESYREGDRAPVIQLVGPDSLSKQMTASQAAVLMGWQHLYRISAKTIAEHSSELTTLARLWERDCLLMPVGLFIDAHETDGRSTSDPGVAAIEQLLDQMSQPAILSTRLSWAVSGTHRTVIDVCKPDSVEQQKVWTKLLGSNSKGLPSLLAGQFNLNLPTIYQIAASRRRGDDNSGEHSEKANSNVQPMTPQECRDLWDACLARTRPGLDSLAHRLDVKATTRDIVLPTMQLNLLDQIVDQSRYRATVYNNWGFRDCMNRGMGISVLFSGESGTGKTMAAEVIASRLRVHLYRIDLSAVVNKYIGETEKNLRRLFDAAEDGGAILFFDEADSLFGKRSEVKDSHDRYANIEINYLLQRMESYSGLAILATNTKSAVDTAFMRRLRFVVDFPFPNREERKQIWQKAFPRRTPKLDFDFLAKMNLSGGSIHNIALNSSFLAAQSRQTEVTMPKVLLAARTEMQKLDRHINESDFEWTEAQPEAA